MLTQIAHRAILFSDDPQLPVLIRSIFEAGGIDIGLISALPAAIYRIRAAAPSLDAAILDQVGKRISLLRPAFPDLRVPLISDCSPGERTIARLPHASVSFMPKPFTISALTSAFREILEEGGGRQGAARQGTRRFGASEGESRTSSMHS